MTDSCRFNDYPASKLNVHAAQSPVGAAEGCDLLILIKWPGSKDRSLRQLLRRPHATVIERVCNGDLTGLPASTLLVPIQNYCIARTCLFPHGGPAYLDVTVTPQGRPHAESFDTAIYLALHLWRCTGSRCRKMVSLQI